MAITEKVSELKDDLRESVHHLKREVAELKDKLKTLVPFRRDAGNVPVRVSGPAARRGWDERFAMTGPWREGAWPWMSRMLADDDWPLPSWPRLDVRDTGDEVRVEAELPGIDDDDLDVSLTDDRLTIRGEKRTEHEDTGRDYYRHERFYGAFHRSVPLPCEVEANRAEATFRKGVLTVRLPKSRAARERTRRIPVRHA